jgi:hypothetical protein
MTNNTNEWKLIKGCYTPKDTNLKNKYIQLVKIFAPVVYFDPMETFFPVDLPSTVTASSLYKVDGKPYEEKATQIKAKVTSADLDSADSNHFTTIVGWNSEKRTISGDPPTEITMPTPKIKEIQNDYSTGKVPAKLTMYATICKPKEVPNYNFLESWPPRIGLKYLQEGLLLNYYFYFPAMVSAEHNHEGDWSGISILFGKEPDTDRNQLKTLLEDMKAVWTCYYRKMNDFMVGYDVGIRTWEQVSKVNDLTTNLDTHPKVYISLGRHNCYYEPVNVNLAVTPKWESSTDPSKIEKGEYNPPDSNTIVGSSDLSSPWWLYALMPWMLFFEACGATCKFDSSGLKGGYSDVNDSVKSGGYEGAPDSTQQGKTSASDSYPSGKPTSGQPVNLKLNTVYVDLYDKTMKEIWKYKGSWGAAEVNEYEYWTEDRDGNKEYSKSRWGIFKGFERPNLSSWFMWNLYWNVGFGSIGWSI